MVRRSALREPRRREVEKSAWNRGQFQTTYSPKYARQDLNLQPLASEASASIQLSYGHICFDSNRGQCFVKGPVKDCAVFDAARESQIPGRTGWSPARSAAVR